MTDKHDLNGKWKFRTDPDNIGEMYPEDVIIAFKDETRFMEPEYDDSNWKEINVPSCWQTEGYLYNGVAWYRKSFVIEDVDLKKTSLLHFHGVDYYCDIWLNGYYIGSHEGYFGRISIDVTKWLDRNNTLTVMVDSPNDTNLLIAGKKEKKLIKGALQDFDANDLFINPGGIWNDVCLEILPVQFIKEVFIDSILNEKYDEADIIAKVNIQNGSNELQKVVMEIEMLPYNFNGKSYDKQKEITLIPGDNSIYDVIQVTDPSLWWTWDIGEPNLYSITVSIKASNDKKISCYCVITGVREIKRINGWELFLNGKRIFLRGINYLSDQLLSNMDNEKYKKDIELVLNANTNIIRTFCNVEKGYFYDLCDEKGILVYQDFPLQWEMSNSSELVRRAILQVSEMIHLLYNHPSIIIWCFGSEPGKKNFEKLGHALSEHACRLDRSRIINQGNSWVEQWDFREFSKKYNWPIDNHFYPGWYMKPWKDIFDINKMNKDQFELVTEFGAQALPSLESLMKIFNKDGVWPPNWKKYQRYCFQKAQQFNWIKLPGNIEELIHYSQEYQAFILKYIIEFLRCRKFEECNGVMMFLFNDNSPSITWSVVDYYRKTKKGYDALKNAYNPMLLAMDWPRVINSGDYPEYKIYIVNDLNENIFDVLVILNIMDLKGNIIHEKIFNLDIDKSMVKTQPFQLKNLRVGDIVHIKLCSGLNTIRENKYIPIPEGDYSVDWFTENCPVV